jgi:hypothetical protein
MEEPANKPVPAPETQPMPAPAEIASAPLKETVSAEKTSEAAPSDTDQPEATAAATPATTPTPAQQTPQNTVKKPIFSIVLSVVLFGALCAVAYYAYSKSN